MAKECVVAMGGEMRVFEIDIHHVEEVSFAYGGFRIEKVEDFGVGRALRLRGLLRRLSPRSTSGAR